MARNILTRLKQDFDYEKSLREKDSIKRANIDYVLSRYESEILANYSGMWVLVQNEPPNLIASYEPFEMLHNLRTQMRLHKGSILVYAAQAASLNPAKTYAPLILAIEDISLEDFLP